VYPVPSRVATVFFQIAKKKAAPAEGHYLFDGIGLWISGWGNDLSKTRNNTGRKNPDYKKWF
jgi:hypothetical protein